MDEHHLVTGMPVHRREDDSAMAQVGQGDRRGAGRSRRRPEPAAGGSGDPLACTELVCIADHYVTFTTEDHTLPGEGRQSPTRSERKPGNPNGCQAERDGPQRLGAYSAGGAAMTPLSISTWVMRMADSIASTAMARRSASATLRRATPSAWAAMPTATASS